ncbi:MAG TPA: hypothetical protein VK069_10055 [Mycolicibacillus parakoreensis]|nr:hypothetical protein [Mycolicibacillus parakoreensis]
MQTVDGTGEPAKTAVRRVGSRAAAPAWVTVPMFTAGAPRRHPCPPPRKEEQ